MKQNKEENLDKKLTEPVRKVHFFNQDISRDFDDYFEGTTSSSSISLTSSQDNAIYTHDDYASSDSMEDNLLGLVPTIDDTDSSLTDEEFDYSRFQNRRIQTFMTSGYEFVILRSLVTEHEMLFFKEIYDIFFEKPHEFPGIKLNLSDHIPSIKNYVVTISGMQCEVARIYGKIAKHLARKENEISSQMSDSKSVFPKVIRLLIPHSLLRNWKGNNVLDLSTIETKSCAKLTVHPTMLPYSTEKIVSIQGSAHSIEKAIIFLSQFMGLEWERALLVIRFIPSTSLLNIIDTENEFHVSDDFFHHAKISDAQI